MPYVNRETTWDRRARLRKERMDAWLLARDSSLPLSRALTVMGQQASSIAQTDRDLYAFGDPDVPRRTLEMWDRQRAASIEARLQVLGYPSLDYLVRHAELRTSPSCVYHRLSYLVLLQMLGPQD